MTNKKDELFDASNVPKSNWASFEKVGDRFSGVVASIYTKKGSAGFEDQKVFELIQADGETVNVGIKCSNTFIIQRTNKVRPGDKIGFEFDKEIAPKVKGHNPAKSIVPYIKYTPEGDAVREQDKANAAYGDF